MPKTCHHSSCEFLDVEIDLGVILQGLADANEAATVFLNGVGQVKAFGNELVAKAGSVVVGLNICHADAAIKHAGAEDGDLVVKNLDLDVARVYVAAVDHGVEQRFAQRWQWVGKALFALNAAVKLKRHANVRDDERHGLLHHFKQGVCQLPIINDHARRFESADVHMVAQGVVGKQQYRRPGRLPVFGDVVELFYRSQGRGGFQGKTPAGIDALDKPVDFAGRQVCKAVVRSGVGIPRYLQRLQIQIRYFIQGQCMVGAGNTFVVAPPGVDGLDRELGNFNGHHGFAFDRVAGQLGDKRWAGG